MNFVEKPLLFGWILEISKKYCLLQEITAAKIELENQVEELNLQHEVDKDSWQIEKEEMVSRNQQLDGEKVTFFIKSPGTGYC